MENFAKVRDRFEAITLRWRGGRKRPAERPANRLIHARFSRLERLEQRALLSIGGGWDQSAPASHLTGAPAWLQEDLEPIDRSAVKLISGDAVTRVPMDSAGGAKSKGVVYSNMNEGTGWSMSEPSDDLGFDDYDSIGNGDITLDEFRFVGGVTNAGDILYFDFYDYDSLLRVGQFGIQFDGGGNFPYTILLDPPITVSAHGILDISAAAGSTGQWLMSDAAPTVGTTHPAYGSGSSNGYSPKFELSGQQAALPEVTITASDPNASEENLDPGEMLLARTGSTGAALVVQYAVGGTATPGADYQTLSTSVTIPAGASSTPITITPIEDSDFEGAETVRLTLSPGPAYAVGSPDAATVIIAENDQPEPAEIRGSKWEDLDGNGVWDQPGEPGLGDWIIYLDIDNSGDLNTGDISTTTDGSGNYSFNGLPVSTYTVAEEPQNGWEKMHPTGLPGTGELTFVEALFDGQPDGQGNLIDGLNAADSMTLSPDGSHIYAVGTYDDAVAVFRRDPSTGELTFVEALVDGQPDGQGNLIDGLDDVRSVTLSPEGSHVYVAGAFDDAVAVFRRNSGTGKLTFVEALFDGQLDGQGNLIGGLEGAYSVTVSPEGSHVYAAGKEDDAVAVFRRDPATGELTFVEALFDGQPDGQGNLIDGLNAARSVTLSPDGSHVYAAGSVDDAVAVFRRDPSTGELTFVEALFDGQPDGQGNLVGGLDMTFSVTVSPEGSHVYVVSAVSDAVAVFRRNPSTGELTFVEALFDGQPDGQDNPVDGLNGAWSVTVSPEGGHVYVAGHYDNAVVVFRRDTGISGTHQVVLGSGEVVTGKDFGNRQTTPPGSHDHRQRSQCLGRESRPGRDASDTHRADRRGAGGEVCSRRHSHPRGGLPDAVDLGNDPRGRGLDADYNYPDRRQSRRRRRNSPIDAQPGPRLSRRLPRRGHGDDR